MLHDVFSISELAIDTQRRVTIGSHEILICRTSTGIYAIQNRCTHAQRPLLGGKVEGDVIRCPTHGAKFELPTGRALAARLDNLKTYLVREVDGRVVVAID